MTGIVVTLQSIAVVGPGLASWDQTRAILAGAAHYEAGPTAAPPPARLPPAERRRTGLAVRIALAVGQQAADAADIDAATLPAVFSASGGDGDNCSAICETLASDDRQISPTRFHNSVHNAPSGYWSIATGAMTPSTALCAYDGSFGAGLIEAACQVVADNRPVLLVAYDSPYPEPLRATRPIPHGFGVGLVLAPEQSPGPRLARLTIALGGDAAETLANPDLEALRTAIPAARALPLLAAIAREETRRVVLEYLDATRLVIECAPEPAN